MPSDKTIIINFRGTPEEREELQATAKRQRRTLGQYVLWLHDRYMAEVAGEAPASIADAAMTHPGETMYLMGVPEALQRIEAGVQRIEEELQQGRAD